MMLELSEVFCIFSYRVFAWNPRFRAYDSMVLDMVASTQEYKCISNLLLVFVEPNACRSGAHVEMLKGCLYRFQVCPVA